MAKKKTKKVKQPEIPWEDNLLYKEEEFLHGAKDTLTNEGMFRNREHRGLPVYGSDEYERHPFSNLR